MSYPAPILNLDFANSKQMVHPSVVFSRSGVRDYTDGTGTVRSARSGVPRFTHDASGKSLGLMVSPQETIESIVYPAELCNIDVTKLRDNNDNQLWSGNEGTIIIEAVTAKSVPTAGSYQWLFSFDDGSYSNMIYCLRSSAGAVGVYVRKNGVVAKDFGFGVIGNDTAIKIAIAFSAFNHAASYNGGAVITDAAAGQPTGMTTLRLGSSVESNSQWGGSIKLIQLYNRRIANTYLPSLSAL